MTAYAQTPDITIVILMTLAMGTVFLLSLRGGKK